MDNSERILEYISINDGITEHKVAKYMMENHYCARDTTHKLIYNTLIPDEKVIDRKIGNSFHKLYINDKNKFISFMHAIEAIHQHMKHFKSMVDEQRKGVKGQILPSFRNQIAILLLRYYFDISQIAHNIELQFKLSDERDALYLRLVPLLKVSNELNILALPFLTTTLKEMNIRENTVFNELISSRVANKKLNEDWYRKASELQKATEDMASIV